MKRIAVLVVFGLLAMPATVWASQAVVGEADLRSTPAANSIYGPGVVGGEAHLVTDGKGEKTRIVTRVEGLRPGTTHVGHIHFGDAADPCARLQPGAIIHNLEPLVANKNGVAVSKTVVADSMAGLADCEWWVAVHEGPENTSPQSPAIAIGPVLIEDEDE